MMISDRLKVFGAVASYHRMTRTVNGGSAIEKELEYQDKR